MNTFQVCQGENVLWLFRKNALTDSSQPAVRAKGMRSIRFKPKHIKCVRSGMENLGFYKSDKTHQKHYQALVPVRMVEWVVLKCFVSSKNPFCLPNLLNVYSDFLPNIRSTEIRICLPYNMTSPIPVNAYIYPVNIFQFILLYSYPLFVQKSKCFLLTEDIRAMITTNESPNSNRVTKLLYNMGLLNSYWVNKQSQGY